MEINTVGDMRAYVKSQKGQMDLEEVIDMVFDFIEEVFEHFQKFIGEQFTPENVARGVLQFVAAIYVAYEKDLSRKFGRTVGKVAEIMNLVFLYFGGKLVAARVN